jgi:hypothetical protein
LRGDPEDALSNSCYLAKSQGKKIVGPQMNSGASHLLRDAMPSGTNDLCRTLVSAITQVFRHNRLILEFLSCSAVNALSPSSLCLSVFPSPWANRPRWVPVHVHLDRQVRSRSSDLTPKSPTRLAKPVRKFLRLRSTRLRTEAHSPNPPRMTQVSLVFKKFEF